MVTAGRARWSTSAPRRSRADGREHAGPSGRGQLGGLGRALFISGIQFIAKLPDLKQLGYSIMYYLFPFEDKITVEFRKYNPGAAGGALPSRLGDPQPYLGHVGPKIRP